MHSLKGYQDLNPLDVLVYTLTVSQFVLLAFALL